MTSKSDTSSPQSEPVTGTHFSEDKTCLNWISARIKLIVSIAFILVSAFCLYIYLWNYIYRQPEQQIPLLGQIGDAMGPLTGLFSTLALAAAIWSVIIQRRELELQREELRLIRKEHEESREVLRKQEEAQARQADLLKDSNELMRHANVLTGKVNFTYSCLVGATRQANTVSLLTERNRTEMESMIAVENLKNLPGAHGKLQVTLSIQSIQEKSAQNCKILDQQLEILRKVEG